MKNIAFISIILCFSFQLVAQGETQIAIGDQEVERFKTSELDYSNIDDTPYLEEEMLSGFLTFIDNNDSDELKLQYDAYSKEFFYVNESGKEVVISLKFIKEVHMHGKEESYLFKRINPRKPHKFYEAVYESAEFDIYNDIKATFHKSTDNGIIQTNAKFSKKDNYYLLRKGEKAKKFKLKKKDFYKQLSTEKKKQVEQLVKEHKIKLKKSKDFKKLFQLMDQ